MYTNIKVGTLKASETELDLEFSTLFDDEYWYTKKTESGELIPFQYTLMMTGKAREEDKEMMKLNVDMHCLKPPMIVGGDGLVDIGPGWSYYYCQTKIEVSGTIIVHGFIEDVEGYAWIDHQWGDFNVGLPKNRVLWEWFSIKLDDNREIMVCDTWRMDNGEKYESTYDGLNYLNADNRYELLEDYQIKQISFWKDPINKKLYANKWRITEPSKNINIIIEPDYPDQLIRLFDLIDPYMPISLWEGSCTVSGIIEGKTVTGKAYTELTHSWE
jgi:predicted secreted hydrolase